MASKAEEILDELKKLKTSMDEQFKALNDKLDQIEDEL